MRAFQVQSFDTPARLSDLPIPAPAKGQVRLKIHACGLNFADLLMQTGRYQDTPQVPFTAGMEVAGVVDALGPDTEGPAIGTRVAAFGGQGGLAEYGVFDVERAVPLPASMSFEQAAAFQIASGTSHVALSYRADLQPNETLLVLGAAGGVGLTAVEIGKLMGARVIACARGQDKLAIAKNAGADHLIDATQDDLRTAVKNLGGADVVYDPVGGDQWKAAFRACNPDARLLPIGFASGEVPQIPANHMLVKNLTVMGVYWGGYLKYKPHVVTDSMAHLFAWFTQGKLSPHISHVLPLDQTAEAMSLLKARKSTGKIVITLP
ncbi:NADPH:quinone oxidoreductase family protein [Cognatishimia sp. WU-CL00825]|uniref:NADPH:quinone oxidoreductase family protein n=1 Tax=Cognatishimia sp. WU-CL00825 TaxID=3127658 RepID=UPI003109C003